MNEPTPIPMNLDPNAYAVSNVSIASSEEDFGITITSGNQVRFYNLTPKHAKRVMLLLQKEVANYEEKFGELLTELPTVPNQTEKKQFGFAEGNKEN
jgi:hypothetical protein